MKKIITILFVFFVLIFSLGQDKAYARQRRFSINTKLKLSDLGNRERDIKIWIPYPFQDQWQEVKDFKYLSPVEGKIIKDKKYGNKILYLHFSSDGSSELEIEVKSTILRKESDFFRKASLDKKRLSQFRKPNRLVPVDSQMRELARDIIQDRKEMIEKAKAIYDYLINEFIYTKKEPRVCKTGNSRLALVFKKGQCSEYHSAFISLMRSLKIPAKFELGFPIPSNKKEGNIGGYHCWAKFYVEDKGWFPVDISEADKHPEKKDYFFGRIDENRVQYTTGRDITLPYARDKEAMPLSYYIYPYVEVDGQEFFNAKIDVSFADK